MVERLVANEKVAGSSPVSRSVFGHKMNLKSTTKYFKEGISLTKKSLRLFVFDIFLILPTYFFNFFQSDPNLKFVLIAVIFLGILAIGFNISLPYLLSQNLVNEKFSIVNIFKIIFKNIKRIFLQALALIFLFAVLVNLVVLLAVLGLRIPFDQVIIFIQNLFRVQSWGIFTLLLISFTSTFVSIYFSIENESLFNSLKKSAQTAIKHYAFVSLTSIISIILPLVASFIPSNVAPLLILQIFVARYINFLTLSTILVYYQKEVKK